MMLALRFSSSVCSCASTKPQFLGDAVGQRVDGAGDPGVLLRAEGVVRIVARVQEVGRDRTRRAEELPFARGRARSDVPLDAETVQRRDIDRSTSLAVISICGVVESRSVAIFATRVEVRREIRDDQRVRPLLDLDAAALRHRRGQRAPAFSAALA